MENKNNLKLWKKVEKTDPKHTKSVSGAGRKLTAINAQQQLKNATSEFGKYGETWGLKNIKLDYINNLSNNQILCIAQAIFYYPSGEFDIGSSILVQTFIREKEYQGKKTPAYNKVDDDFLKKLETDMMTKSLSKLGFNADVFLGYYDDNKYVAKVTQEFNQQRKPALTDSQFESAKKGTQNQITTVLNKFRMSKEHRQELTKLLSNGSN